ncbi:MAG: sodium:proton antiporter [Rhodospirillaceae bacterium]
MTARWSWPLAVLLFAAAAAGPALAAGSGAGGGIDGRGLELWWGLPFTGLLLSIALLPAALPGLWHRRFGAVSLVWALAFVVPYALRFGGDAIAAGLVHIMVLDYLPFVILIGASYVVTGGVRLGRGCGGTPAANVAVLATGTLLAGLVGSTCASMLLIRPLLAGNEARRQKAHLVVFLIVLVGNIGGGLTPLGNPPVFLGFLEGIDFFWTARHLGPPILLATLVLLGVFFLIDRCWYNREVASGLLPPGAAAGPSTGGPRLEGGDNLVLMGAVALTVLFQGLWRPELGVAIAGVRVPLETLVAEALMVAIATLSLCLTGGAARQARGFRWRPLVEVAVLFAAIFVTVAPMLAILQAGHEGAAAGWLAGLDPARLFWLAGGLSSVLDNAPTWLVFFHAAGGDAAALMGREAPTLLAITMGAVFMGALTYVGNSPNLMLKAIVEDRGIAMPGFFGYLLWAALLLLPLFGCMTLIWF